MCLAKSCFKVVAKVVSKFSIFRKILKQLFRLLFQKNLKEIVRKSSQCLTGFSPQIRLPQCYVYQRWLWKAEHYNLYEAEIQFIHILNIFSFFILANVVRHGRLRWFGHLEHRSVDDWVSACRKVEVAGARKGRLGKNVWIKIWKCLVYILNGRYSGMCGGTSYGQTSNPSIAWKKSTFSK